MESIKGSFTSIDEYIASCPEETRKILEEIRSIIKTAAPQAYEKISYQMPTFDLKGNLVHFAAHKNHIGFYPTPSGIEKFKQELSAYESSKGAVQFPLDKPIPFGLISKIVAFRVQENLEKAAAKKKKRLPELDIIYLERYTGRVTVNRLPLPGVLSTLICPPWAATSSRAIVSPRPMPCLMRRPVSPR